MKTQHTAREARYNCISIQVGRACKYSSQVIPHVGEVQVLLCDREVGLKGSNLLSKDEQLLYEEQLPIHRG